MKITQIRTQPIEIPLDKPLGTSIHRITSVAALLVWIDTDEGITGESYLWVIGKHKLPVLMEMVRSLEPVVKHRNPLDVAARFDEMWNEINFLGHKGVTIFGIAAIDWACWDIKGKSLGVSLGDLLGRKRDKIPAYASGGLWIVRGTKTPCAPKGKMSSICFAPRVATSPMPRASISRRRSASAAGPWLRPT